VFGPLLVVPALALGFWSPPTLVTVVAVVLVVGSVAGVVLGLSMRISTEPGVVRVRTLLGEKEFPAGQSSVRTETMSSMFGTRTFSFLVLERQGAKEQSARVPLSEFPPEVRTRLETSMRASLRAT